MNHKTGLDYFPLDIDFFQDEKIEFVSARFGIKGELIAVRLLCKIYRQGYYLHWDDDAALLFAKGVGDGVQHSCVNDVVYELLKRGFFDKSIFKRFSILTSKGIQKRYFEASKRRKNVPAIREILLIDGHYLENVDILFQDVNILGEDADILKQSKVKESKVKESKVIEATDCDDIFAGRSFSDTVQAAVVDWLEYKKERKDTYKPKGLSALLSQIENRCKELSEEQVVYAINESMACNYQGIIWDKAKKIGKGTLKPNFDDIVKEMEHAG